MKPFASRIVPLALVMIVAMVFMGCQRSAPVQVSFTVEGMHCESCSSAITEALEKVDGVESASADHVTGFAEALFVSPGVTPEQLKTEIEGLGYTVTEVVAAPLES